MSSTTTRHEVPKKVTQTSIMARFIKILLHKYTPHPSEEYLQLVQQLLLCLLLVYVPHVQSLVALRFRHCNVNTCSDLVPI